MKNMFKKILCLLIVTGMLAGNPAYVRAEETDESFVTEGTYSYTSNENHNIQEEDSFSFRKDCFMRSSYLGCYHLYELSASAAIATASRYGDAEDPYEVDPSGNAENIVKMLQDMGFEDVETNKYYTLEKLDDSAGVAVGHMSIEVSGKEYTLLAIMPRSAGYKAEWVGNFTVGDGDIHEGFKAARDEILRFVKQYMEENGISGDLKVWTAGHSRGSALSNMVAGFFAGGGIGYFGDGVSITPEDVYCYTFADPTVIKNGADRNEELSVAGYRGGVYADDTPGEAYAYEGGGTVDVKDEIYDGIRNYPLSYDLITMLPPEDWGFTLYGQIFDPDGLEGLTPEDMLEELKPLNTYAYESFTKDGDPRSFEWRTFDIDSLEFITDPNKQGGSLEEFMKGRVEGLSYHASDNEEYVSNGAQETMKSVAGLYGLLLSMVNGGEEVKTDGIVKPLLLTYLSYAAERLTEEGRAADEYEAASIAIADLLSFIRNEEIEFDDGYLVSDLVYALLEAILYEKDGDELVEKNTKLKETLIGLIVPLIPEDFVDFVMMEDLFGGYDKNCGTDVPITLESVFEAFFRACVVGPDPECYHKDKDIEVVRSELYSVLTLAVGDYDLLEVIGDDGGNPVKDLVEYLVDTLKTVKDDEGEVIKTYDTLAEAADDALTELINNMFAGMIENSATIYDQKYHDEIIRYMDTLTANIDMARKLVSYIAFYTEGGFDSESIVRTISTFYNCFGMVPPAHFNEVYLAWARAARKKGADCCDHYIVKVEAKDPTCTEDGTIEHWLYHEHDEDRFFKEKTLANELSEEDIKDEKLGHDWGEWTVVKEATYEEEGLKTRTCRRCQEEESLPIPKLGEPVYSSTQGDGQIWTIGNTVPATFVFKRSIDDETCYSHFEGILVDGEEVGEENYESYSGSTVVRLKSSYLEMLKVGEHTMTALFDDGNDPEVTFTIRKKDDRKDDEKEEDKKQESRQYTAPKTGVEHTAYALLGLISVLGVMTAGKKRK